MRMPFRSPTDYYCQDLAPLDEEICALLAKRKERSKNNPGFPGLDLIAAWSEKFGLNENWLRRIFALFLRSEIDYNPPAEPTGFLKYVAILKSTELDNISHTVTYMKQYSNASVVNIETEVNTPDPFVRLGHASFELFISPDYQCRQYGGRGSGKGWQHSFMVTPPLPDDVTDFEFRLEIKPFPLDEFKEVVVTGTTVRIK